MEVTMVIPTYWARTGSVGWQEGDAVYDHPTPLDQEDTLLRSLQSMEVLADKMTEVVKESGIDPAKIQKPVDKMFGRLMRKFLNEGPFSFRKMRRLSSLMDEFSRKMNKLMDSEKPESQFFEPIADEPVVSASPVEVLSMKKSTVETHVSFFEQSVSFSFQYSKGEQEESSVEEVSVEG